MLLIVQFIWMSYQRPKITTVIPSSAHIHSHLWCINVPITNFQTVKWYNEDRVLRQFGCIQYIPDLLMQLGKIYLINKRENMEIIGSPQHMHQLGTYELVPNIEAELQLEPEPQSEPEPERSHTHLADSSYHPELRTPPDMYPPQYSTPPWSYTPQYGTPPSLSSSTAFRAYDFSFMFRTPQPATEEDVDRRNHPQRER
ncbi:hypothetical protein Gotur_022344 [Gossypium turneri]